MQPHRHISDATETDKDCRIQRQFSGFDMRSSTTASTARKSCRLIHHEPSFLVCCMRFQATTSGGTHSSSSREAIPFVQKPKDWLFSRFDCLLTNCKSSSGRTILDLKGHRPVERAREDERAVTSTTEGWTRLDVLLIPRLGRARIRCSADAQPGLTRNQVVILVEASCAGLALSDICRLIC